jgi:hypothetical protein
MWNKSQKYENIYFLTPKHNLQKCLQAHCRIGLAKMNPMMQELNPYVQDMAHRESRMDEKSYM